MPEPRMRGAEALVAYGAWPPRQERAWEGGALGGTETRNETQTQNETETQDETQTQNELIPRPEYFRGLRYLGQLHRTYLVCEGPRGLVLIDQHAAHHRINSHPLRQPRPRPAQPLLVPHLLPLPPPPA